MRSVAIVLSAGSGKRMGSAIPKQYLPLNGRPVIYYSLKAFEDSFIDEIILVCGKDDIDYCNNEIVKRFKFKKITKVVAGGKERYLSVGRGLAAADDCDYVYIHDGARPLISTDLLERARECVREYGACVAGMPVKDTIKVVDDQGIVIETPRRETLYQIQTPQVFRYDIIAEAYEKLYNLGDEIEKKGITITDDAMLVEYMTGHTIKVYKGDYVNLKITSPEDLLLAGNLME